MNIQTKKILVFLSFFILFFGGAAFMYYKFIHNRPKIRVIAPRTEVDPLKFDSLLLEKQKQKKANNDKL
jgi:hypothetical protein